MLVYTVIKEFCLHPLSETLLVGDTVGKLQTRIELSPVDSASRLPLGEIASASPVWPLCEIV